MKKLEELTALEKRSNADVRFCEIVADEDKLETNERARILKDGERYFFHKMKDGEITECFEIALSWKPFPDVLIFEYTPDDRHILKIDSRSLFRVDVLAMHREQIKSGDKCEYKGHTLEYIDENAIAFDGKQIKVKTDYDYTYKLQKRQIRAIDAARGLFIFLEEIAYTSQFEKFPMFYQVWEIMAEKYTA